MSRRVAELSPGDVFMFIGVVGTFRVVRISALSATIRRATRKRREYDALDKRTLEVKHVAYDVDEDAFTVSRGALVERLLKDNECTCSSDGSRSSRN